MRPVIEVIESFNSDEDARQGERFWITQFRALGFRLTNHTDGGEGTTGHRFRHNKSQAHQEKINAALRGRSIDDYTKKKISETVKADWAAREPHLVTCGTCSAVFNARSFKARFCSRPCRPSRLARSTQEKRA